MDVNVCYVLNNTGGQEGDRNGVSGEQTIGKVLWESKCEKKSGRAVVADHKDLCPANHTVL